MSHGRIFKCRKKRNFGNKNRLDVGYSFTKTFPEDFGTAVAQWLRCCATNLKVAGFFFAAGVNGFFIHIKSFRSHCGPGVDSTSNRNEYQEYFLRVRAAGA